MDITAHTAPAAATAHLCRQRRLEHERVQTTPQELRAARNTGGVTYHISLASKPYVTSNESPARPRTPVATPSTPPCNTPPPTCSPPPFPCRHPIPDCSIPQRHSTQPRTGAQRQHANPCARNYPFPLLPHTRTCLSPASTMVSSRLQPSPVAAQLSCWWARAGHGSACQKDCELQAACRTDPVGSVAKCRVACGSPRCVPLSNRLTVTSLSSSAASGSSGAADDKITPPSLVMVAWLASSVRSWSRPGCTRRQTQGIRVGVGKELVCTKASPTSTNAWMQTVCTTGMSSYCRNGPSNGAHRVDRTFPRPHARRAPATPATRPGAPCRRYCDTQCCICCGEVADRPDIFGATRPGRPTATQTSDLMATSCGAIKPPNLPTAVIPQASCTVSQCCSTFSLVSHHTRLQTLNPTRETCRTTSLSVHSSLAKMQMLQQRVVMRQARPAALKPVLPGACLAFAWERWAMATRLVDSQQTTLTLTATCSIAGALRTRAVVVRAQQVRGAACLSPHSMSWRGGTRY